VLSHITKGETNLFIFNRKSLNATIDL